MPQCINKSVLGSGQRPGNTGVVYPGSVITFVNGSGSNYVYATAGPKAGTGKFYSAGHALTGPAPIPDVHYGMATTSTTKIGTAASRILGADGDCCTVTVTLSSNLPSTNGFPLGTGRYSLSSSFLVGTDVEMWGGYSGITTGTVLQKNLTVRVQTGGLGTSDTSDDVYMLTGNLTLATYSSQQGDSGAAVFSLNAQHDSQAKCYGIQSCSMFPEGSSIAIASYFSALPN